jgi:rubrerythrin
MQSDELVKFLEKQIDVEKRIVDSINKGLKLVANPAVKGSLKAISLDSVKHAELYSAALKLLEGAVPDVAQELTSADVDEQKRLVERHIQMEAELMETLEYLIPKLQNEKLELLLKVILEDERRHHSLLKKIQQILVSREAVSEEWWDILRTERIPRW